MAAPNNLATDVHVCEDTDQTFSVLSLLSKAGYVPSGPVVIDRIQVQNPDGSYSTAPTSLVRIAEGGSGFVVTASGDPNWNGSFTTFNFLIGSGSEFFSIKVGVTVDPVNDAPEGTDNTINLVDGSGYVLREADFGYRDPVEGDAFKSVVISSLPVSGQVLLNGRVLAAGAEVGIADIRAGKLVYLPPVGGAGEVSLGFQVRDDGGTEGCNASDLDGTPNHIDFQLPPLGRIGDRVWIDADRDGVQDANEAGAAGVAVTLAGAGADGVFGTADDISRSTTTNGAGHYLFDGLAAGTYLVTFGSLAGYQFTSPFVGNSATDSDANANGLSPLVTLAAGESNLSLDAGLVTQIHVDPGTAQLGDRVWIDANRNGVQDNGEVGVAGVAVTLSGAGADGVFGTADDVSRGTTTNSAGNYLFTGLSAGQYQVTFGGASGYQFTTADAGGNDATDSDANTGTGKSQVVALAIGESNLTVDAGLVQTDTKTAQLGDRVWIDTNRNGVQDSGEAGVSGVAVTLAGAGADGVFGTADDISRSTTTDANGNYLFGGLAAGQYQVGFGGKGGYQFTTADVGNDATDSDANTGTGKSQVVALAIGESNLTVDAGLVQTDTNTAQLGDRVWIDTNRNGVQDSGEVGVSGVAVTLAGAGADGVFGTADDISRSTTTDANGNYLFGGLAAGQYQVGFGGKGGYQFTTADVGNDATDSDANTGTGKSQVVALAIGESNLTVDAGLVQTDTNTAQLGDRVWIDTNRNGVQDSGEAGVAGVAVTLTGAGADGVFGTADDVSRSTTTNSAGNYLFAGLAAGQYQVGFGGASGYQFTTADAGGNDATDSDANTGTGRSQVVALAIGESNLTVDAGLVQMDTKTAQLGDRVWIDANRNGVQDSGEAGVSGVAVTLAGAGADGVFGTADDISRSTTTDANGNYLFGGLSAGQYQVGFGGASGYQFTTADAGGNDATDSDANTGTGRSQVVALAIGESNLTVDAGLVQTDTNTAQLGDRVWIDANRNGVQDSGEAGVSGVAVTLTGAGADGLFGTADDISRSTTTDANGNYLFGGLSAGQYQVGFGGKSGYQFTTADVGNDATDSDANTGTGKSQVVALAIGESNLTVDAGLVQTDTNTAQLGDRVWIDTNRNGVQDSGEAGVAGVAVTLAGAGADGVFGTADDVSRSTTTNSAGNYLFAGLAAGQYQVGFGGKSGYQLTKADVGNDATDSDANTGTGRSQVVALAIGESNLTVDAGLVQIETNTAQLGDRVWVDTNRNGVQDAGEAGKAGVSVQLRGAGADGIWNNADDINVFSQTDASGFYKFSGLAAGQYQVRFGDVAGYQLTTADAGGNDATDSDASLLTRQSQVVSLAIGETNLTVDAGLVQIETNTAQLGDRVWVDTNRNGVQDAGEAGKAGVSVQLRGAGADGIWNNADDISVFSQTDASGFYKFSGLAAGQYQVRFGDVNGYQLTTADAGGNDATDSDANLLTRQSQVVSLAIGETNLTVDAGLIQLETKTAQLGDRVWLDANRNGVQDSGEVGLAGVSVHLLSAGADGIWNTGDDTRISSQTDSNGNYLFSGLAAGQYQIDFDKLTGYEFTNPDVGGNDATDSDVNNFSTGLSQVITLAIGETNRTVDAGLVQNAVKTGAIGDRVWADDPGNRGAGYANGIQDSNEPYGLAGVKVYLYESTSGVGGGTLVASTVTDSGGYYRFNNLAAGWYQVEFDKGGVKNTSTPYSPGSWLDAWHWSPKDQGGNDLVDSDVATTGNRVRTDVFWLNTGQIDLSRDAGLTPIVIDLDGDGIHTVARGASDATFDLFGNGSAIQSGWLSGRDGFLAVDRNGNGRIDDIHELFGGSAKGEGFAELASFDSNGDGRVDALDAGFDQLLVWQDVNGNHQTDAGELRTLAQAGLASLTVGYTELPTLDTQGNLHLERSNAVMSDGRSVDMTDVYFNVDAADAAAAGVKLPTMAELLGVDNALLEQALGGGHAGNERAVCESPAIAGAGFDAASEAQRLLASLLAHADAGVAAVG